MTFSAFLHLGLIDNAGALHCRISKRMFSFEDHNGISEAIYPGLPPRSEAAIFRPFGSNFRYHAVLPS
ncbi:hypothetical protein QYF36_010862 [Acer negundo]|nr:hypothetical protein QYF36_010862 [Acer negundo]